MIAIPWKEIGKYGFATVALVFVGIYYRIDVVLPSRERETKLIEINEMMAKAATKQTQLMESQDRRLGSIEYDMRYGTWRSTEPPPPAALPASPPLPPPEPKP